MRIIAKLYASIAAGALLVAGALAPSHSSSDTSTALQASDVKGNVTINNVPVENATEEGTLENATSSLANEEAPRIRNATYDGSIADYNEEYGTNADTGAQPLWTKPQTGPRIRRSLGSADPRKIIYLAILVEFPDDNMQGIHLDSADALRALDIIGHTGGLNYSRLDGQYHPIVSMQDYFKQQSYGKVDVDLQVFPRENDQATGKPISHVSSRPRTYYMPYSATNPDGYSGMPQRMQREGELLKEALQAAEPSITASYTKEQLDSNGDGIIDAVNFIVESPSTPEKDVGWSDLLWSHNVRYSLGTSSYGLRVPQYTLNNAFDPSSSGGIMSYTGSGKYVKLNNAEYDTLIHELLHAFGLEDFYRAANDGAPVGLFDIMANHHPLVAQPLLSFNRNTMLGWGNEVPEIQPDMEYTLRKPQWVDPSEPVAAIIRVPAERLTYATNSIKNDQYFVVEYYDKRNIYPDAGDRSGIIIYRINNSQTLGNINASQSAPEKDQLFIFRNEKTLGAAADEGRGSLPGAVHNTPGEVIGTYAETSGDKSIPWDPKSIYYDNGSNSGIVLTITASTEDSVTFRYSYPTEPTAEPTPEESLVNYTIYYCLQAQDMSNNCSLPEAYVVRGSAAEGATVQVPKKDIPGFTYGGLLPYAHGDSFIVSAYDSEKNQRSVWYSRNQYQLTYAGEAGSKPFPVTRTYAYGTEVTLPDPGTREGYAFDHWHIEAADGSPLPYGVDAEYPAGETLTIAGAFTVTAVWTSTTIPELPATGGDLRGAYLGGAVLLLVILGSSVAARRIRY